MTTGRINQVTIMRRDTANRALRHGRVSYGRARQVGDLGLHLASDGSAVWAGPVALSPPSSFPLYVPQGTGPPHTQGAARATCE